MRRWLKISLIVVGCLVAFQMFLRYDIKIATEGSSEGSLRFRPLGSSGSYVVVTDRLTGRGYWFSGRYSLFPYPHK
jgi:hypothetical protein